MKPSPPKAQMDPLIRPEDILFRERPKQRLTSLRRERSFFLFLTMVAGVFSFVVAFSATHFFRSARVEVASERQMISEPESAPAAPERAEPVHVNRSGGVAPTQPGKAVTIKADDTLWQILIDNYGTFSPDILKQVLQANPVLAQSGGDKLTVGDQIILPPLPAKTGTL